MISRAALSGLYKPREGCRERYEFTDVITFKRKKERKKERMKERMKERKNERKEGRKKEKTSIRYGERKKAKKKERKKKGRKKRFKIQCTLHFLHILAVSLTRLLYTRDTGGRRSLIFLPYCFFVIISYCSRPIATANF